MKKIRRIWLPSTLRYYSLKIAKKLICNSPNSGIVLQNTILNKLNVNLQMHSIFHKYCLKNSFIPLLIRILTEKLLGRLDTQKELIRAKYLMVNEFSIRFAASVLKNTMRRLFSLKSNFRTGRNSNNDAD